jgi:hypothetical protein
MPVLWAGDLKEQAMDGREEEPNCNCCEGLAGFDVTDLS